MGRKLIINMPNEENKMTSAINIKMTNIINMDNRYSLHRPLIQAVVEYVFVLFSFYGPGIT